MLRECKDEEKNKPDKERKIHNISKVVSNIIASSNVVYNVYIYHIIASSNVVFGTL